MASHQRAPAKRRFKRVLVVRHLAAQTAWLDTMPRWHEGRVCWLFHFGNEVRWLTPGAVELASSERALNKIGNYPRALETTFGTEQQSGGDWLQARRRQLETVKVLARLGAPDLPLLARSSHSRNPATLTRLVELLLAESLCRNALPYSPAEILRRWTQDISQELSAVCTDGNQAIEMRLLAAMILGARDEHQDSFLEKNQRPLWHAWQWGHSFGLPEAPGFVARLLAADNSGALATRFKKAGPLTQKMGCPFDFWADIFAARPAPDAVHLLEAFASCESIVWQSPTSQLSPALQTLMGQLQEKQREVQGKFCRLLCQLAREGDGTTIEALRGFIQEFWQIETPLALWAAPSSQWQSQRGNPLLWPLLHQQASRHLLFILREVHKLPPNKQGAAFRLLKENVPAIWNEDSLKASSPRHDISKQVKDWLYKRWSKKGTPLLRLIGQVSEQTTRRAIALNALHILRYRTWRDEALAEWAFDIAETLATESHDAASHLDDLFDLLEEYPSLAAAQDELSSLFEVLRGEEYRGVVARSIIIHLGWTNKSQRNARQMPPYLPAITALKSLDEVWDVARFADAASLLDREMRAGARRHFLEQQKLKPKNEDVCDQEVFDEEIFEEWPHTTGEAARWLDWMAADILRTRPQSSDKDDPVVYYDLEDATLLSWVLSGGDFALFQKLFSVAARHDFPSLETMRQAARSLQNYPAATAALGYLFPIQAGRLTALLKRWGLTRRLGDVQKPLEVFREMPTAVPLVYGELLQLVPELWQEAALLAHAQRIAGTSFDLPPGLRRVLEMPRKMDSERAHLAARHQQTPRSDWAARLAMLDKRLENRSELQRVMAEEMGEKLPEIAFRTMLEAIEQQVAQCYRIRLREVAGPLPPSLKLDDDWMNAILLTGDIQYNRKLLRNLLRALVNGENSWHQTHPANVNFLRELEARGVTTKAWLGTMPRRFKVSRGTWHLRLEKHPLTILQMGNYFDTCLSFGGGNSFSTVANACELNKRVIFARDEKGRVVGRKLIGLNEDSQLIGFYTYTSLHDTEANQELRRCFARYCEIFAERCGLEMAEGGTIPRLFAEHWYDDGVVRWRDEDETTPQVKPQFKSLGKRKSDSHATTSGLMAKRSE